MLCPDSHRQHLTTSVEPSAFKNQRVPLEICGWGSAGDPSPTVICSLTFFLPELELVSRTCMGYGSYRAGRS